MPQRKRKRTYRYSLWPAYGNWVIRDNDESRIVSMSTRKKDAQLVYRALNRIRKKRR